MHAENSIVMKAPIDRVFETAADLSLWPAILPHYRWIRYLERSPEKNVVRMAAFRYLPFGKARLPVQWTSEQTIDRTAREVRFRHLRAFTKGMVVVWSFTQQPEGVLVRIRHDLQPTIPVIGGFIAEQIVGKFFIQFIAGQTLKHMKRYVEEQYGA